MICCPAAEDPSRVTQQMQLDESRTGLRRGAGGIHVSQQRTGERIRLPDVLAVFILIPLVLLRRNRPRRCWAAGSGRTCWRDKSLDAPAIRGGGAMGELLGLFSAHMSELHT